jgi:hypothetical protein
VRPRWGRARLLTRLVKEPLFILGAPRSGTSLLYRALALHPEAAWISNYGRRVPSLPQLAYLNRVARRAPGLRRKAWFGDAGDGAGDDAYRYGRRRSVLERAFPQPVEGEPLFERRGVVHGADPSSIESGPALLRDDLARLARAAGASTVVSKRTGHNRRVALLDAMFPDCRFVVISRDGRAAARSLVAADWWPDTELWWYGGTPRDWERRGGDPLELAARHWVKEVEAIESGLAAVPPERVHRLSYEDLVRAPFDRLRETAVFAGLSDDPGWRAELAHVPFPDQNRAASAILDGRVELIQGKTLRALGYSA